MKITVLLNVQEQKTAVQYMVKIKNYIDSVYRGASQKGVQVPLELARAFTVNLDSAGRVQINIQMKQEDGLLFLQQFFQSLQQNL